MKATVIVATAVIVGVAFGGREIYLRNFNSLKREIEKHGNLKITQSWRNNDLVLDDFGFTVNGPSGEFKIDLFGESCSSIHSVHSHVEGLLVTRSDHPSEIEVVSFDDPWWKAQNLPVIQDIAEFLDHSDAIVRALSTGSHGMKPLTDFQTGNYRRHIHLLLENKPGA